MIKQLDRPITMLTNKRWILCIILVVFLYTSILYFSHQYLFSYGDQFRIIFNFTDEAESRPERIEIWAKAAIGNFLWVHLLEQEIKKIHDGFYEIGHANLMGMNFVFRSGPGYIQTTVPQDVEYLILTLNGRTEKNIEKSIEWLDYLEKLKELRRVAVILLGDEKCQNEWILKYLRSRGGLVDLLFVVYDWALIDNTEIFQWPLGVATYRGFTRMERTRSLIHKKRPFKCNFVGTVYENSSREIMRDVLKKKKMHKTCYLSARTTWVPKETEQSLSEYKKALLSSDLTLSPVGKNTECYRIYEAVSFGSIPVVEDVMTAGNCKSPLRLLKEYKAPFIYIKNWTTVADIVKHDKTLSENYIRSRREKLLFWYKYFKYSVGAKFLRTLRETFFN